MNDNIRKFKPLAETNMSMGRFKKCVEASELVDGMLIGYDADGDLVVLSSAMSRRDALWMLEMAKNYTMGR